jgi:GT2 family glycosyltransferase
VSARPAVAVIVPFAGSETELSKLMRRLDGLRTRDDDELIIADNRAPARTAQRGRILVIEAAGVPTPAHARNRGADAAQADWLLFVDADTAPAPDLLDAMFQPPPAPRTAVLAGEIVDVAAGDRLAARHAVARRRLSQQTTLDRGEFAYAQTANCAIRAAAFAEVGGFAAQARAAEDADLCFRLRRAGWELEYRPSALVRHLSRGTVRASLVQLLRHGSGAGWLDRRYPGSIAAQEPARLVRTLGHHARCAAAAAVHADGEQAAFALLDLAGTLAFALGRALPNRRRPRRSPVLSAHTRGSSAVTGSRGRDGDAPKP